LKEGEKFDKVWEDWLAKQPISSKLYSFFAKPSFLISGNDNLHHELIVLILILEHACLSYASQSELTTDMALNQAYSLYCASDIYIEIIKEFSAPPKEYSILQFTDFILKHRL